MPLPYYVTWTPGKLSAHVLSITRVSWALRQTVQSWNKRLCGSFLVARFLISLLLLHGGFLGLYREQLNKRKQVCVSGFPFYFQLAVGLGSPQGSHTRE